MGKYWLLSILELFQSIICYGRHFIIQFNKNKEHITFKLDR